jgi:hypothetical protein
MFFLPGFADCPELVDNIGSNYDFWKQKLEEEQETGQRLTFTKRADRVNHQQQQQQQQAVDKAQQQPARQPLDRTTRSASVKRVPGIIEEDSACDSSATQSADQSEAASLAGDQSQGAS